MDSVDFSWEGARPAGGHHTHTLRTPDDAMHILRDQCLELCDGDMPKHKAQRVALVVSAMAALTLKTTTFLKQQHPHAPAEQLARSGQHAIALLSAAATFVLLDLFDFDFDQFMAEMMANSAAGWAKFSDN